MITHISHRYTDQEALEALLNDGKLLETISSSSSMLVQIFSADTNVVHLRTVSALVSTKLPRAIVVGATTVGEVYEGRLLTNSTVVGITCFESSTISVMAMPCQGADVRQAGAELGTRISQCPGKIAGVILLATPLSIDAGALLQGIESTAGGFPIFGGGAGDYAAMTHSLVFAGDQHYPQGAVAVVLAGDDLHIESSTYLGWRPLSKSMQVTEVDQLLVKTVDGKPAFDVYRHYLNISNDENFFLNALEFPFLLERSGELVARVPIAADSDGALQFIADIQAGERFRIGYGDMDLIVSDALHIHQSMAGFSPQAIFLYTCGCRRFLMQNDVDLETMPFEALAPTFGFYTYGEFFSSNHLRLLNSTMVAIGLREGETTDAGSDRAPAHHAGTAVDGSDPYAHKHTRVVSRLVRFIDAVTAELEASNREITQLSRTDRLTQLVNRIQLDHVLEENLQQALRYAVPFSIILLDLDHFKQVNDVHGHLVGDEVLVSTARILTANTRITDTVGRWGGEEFLIVVPNAGLGDAARLAEKLRSGIEAHDFPAVGKMTASFGVTCFEPEDDVVTMISRADMTLYAAKHAGRNRVEVA
ncbi:sensor domain-containing diguanylate cyclase [Castellaniella sp. S9]|uniref:sensor domain-containing diguanylate cyclase n=1 Tax=Castellaniella sp. S9 TaxID=2993652 RepID=UPI0022B3463A|nr:GGDEF domain-containing protein [Castellaniella sp. S9]